MALKALDIYKLLPKKNCKECGDPTCLTFAMKLAGGKADVDLCPYLDDQAKSVLGATTVKCLALSTSVFHPEKIARESVVDAAEYFMYVLSVAAGCQKIARAVSYPSTEEAFIAGLLHDIGVMFFLHKYPREYKQIIAHESHVDSLAEAEKNIFGTDHTEVGLHMAEVWRIPREIVEAIGNHHSSPVKGEGGSLSNIVRLAVLMSRDRWSGYEVGLEDRLNEINAAAGTLSLSKDQIDSISSSLLIDTLEIAEYLGVPLAPSTIETT